MKTEIRIRGMGGIINFEMLVIQKALEAAGYTVEIQNDAADWSCSAQEGWYETVLAQNQKNKEKIKLVADHVPWGG